MKLRMFITASIALNVLLVAALGFLERKPSTPAPQSVTRIPNTGVVSGTTTVERHAPKVESPRPFHWSEVESGDFAVYIANLRAIGCPEETIRDIIRADVGDLFARRRRELLAPFQSEFWELMVRGEEAMKERKIDDQIEALNEEKEKLLERLLGVERGDSDRRPPRFYPSAELDFLPEDKQRQVADHLQKYARLGQELQNGNGSDAERATANKALAEQSEADLKRLLTPEEYSEYKLRQSRAVHFAQNLYGFEPDEKEFREIARTRLEFDQSRPQSDQNDPDYAAKQVERQEAERVVDERIQSVLGEERFTEFKRGQDPQFQEIVRVTGRFGLPDATAVNLFHMRQAAEEKAREIRANPAWDEDRRTAALRAVRRETERAIEEALGSSGLRTYQRYGGGWIDAMTRPPREENDEE